MRDLSIYVNPLFHILKCAIVVYLYKTLWILHIILSEQFMMNVKQNLVSTVESVLICSGMSTATVMGLDTLEASVKSQVHKPMTNLLPK